jgi:hypothetical protein
MTKLYRTYNELIFDEPELTLKDIIKKYLYFRNFQGADLRGAIYDDSLTTNK